MKSLRALLTVAVMLFGAVSAHAQAVSGQGTWETTLQARDVGNTGTTNAFYDTALNITWLRDANVNRGNGNNIPNVSYIPDGLMTLASASTWANQLTIGGVGGWRLPTMTNSVSDCYGVHFSGAACSVSALTAAGEMPHLFYATLGNIAGHDSNGNILPGGYGLTNTGNFQNLLNYTYWSGTAISNGAWVFYNGGGETYSYSNGDAYFYAMAVHSGDVGTVVASVPEPETYAMLLGDVPFVVEG